MGDGSSTFIIDTIVIPPSPPTSQPQTSTIPSTSTPVVSPNYQAVMNEPLTYFFSSQSTEVEKTINEEEVHEHDVMVGFADLQVNPDKDDILDNAITFGKKIQEP